MIMLIKNKYVIASNFYSQNKNTFSMIGQSGKAISRAELGYCDFEYVDQLAKINDQILATQIIHSH